MNRITEKQKNQMSSYKLNALEQAMYDSLLAQDTLTSQQLDLFKQLKRTVENKHTKGAKNRG